MEACNISQEFQQVAARRYTARPAVELEATPELRRSGEHDRQIPL